MKLKILPPTLRPYKRYIAFQLISQKPISRDELIELTWNACLNYYGEKETSKFRLWLIKYWDSEKNNNYFLTKGIIKCERGSEPQIRIAISLINSYKGNRLAFQTLGTSGTIKNAIKKFIKLSNQNIISNTIY